MSRYSPPPWQVTPNYDVKTADGFVIMAPGTSAQEIRASAALIAATPDMLRLLHVLTSNWHDASEPDQNAFADAMSDADDLVKRLMQDS